MPQVPAGLSNRRFGNIRDQNLFKKGITYNRINSNPMRPSAPKRVPGAFSRVIGKPPSGGLSAFGRKKPSFSASKFASRFSKARHQAGRRGRRRLLSLDEVDIDPAFSKAIDTAQGEEKRQKRRATTRNRKRRRRPIKMLPRMSVEDFINAHQRRGRGRKMQNGWTTLSGGWRYRDVRSVGGENSSDSFLPLELTVPPNGQSQQKSEDDSQEVSLRSKRNIVRNDLGSMLGRLRQRKGAQRFQKKNLWTDQYLSGQRRRGERSTNGQNITNTAEYPLTGTYIISF